MPTAPTLVQAAYASATTATITSPSVSWQTGDVIVVIYGNDGASGDNLRAPTNTGSGVTLTTQQTVDSGSYCGAQLLTSVATANSSGTFTCGTTSTACHCRIAVFVWRGSDGVGNHAGTAAPDATRTVSLTPTAADSAICWGVFDWNADSVQTVTPTQSTHSSGSPGPQAMPQNALDAGNFTYYIGDLDDQTSAGATSYGVGGSNSGPFTILAVEVKGTTGGGVTVDLGEPSETDTAQALTESKVATFGQPSETGTAQPLTETKVLTAGQPASTSTAHPVSMAKSLTLSFPTETDSAFTLTVGGSSSFTLNQASETDTAFALGGGTKSTSVGQSSETNSALAVALSKSITIGQGLVLGLGIALETDTALALTVTKSAVTFGLPAETDTGAAVAPTKVVLLGLPVETDSAFSVSSATGPIVHLGLPTDTSSAFSLTFGPRTKVLGLAVSTESALALTTFVPGIDLGVLLASLSVDELTGSLSIETLVGELL